MNVQILSTETIKPLAPTPHHLRNYKLSLIDQFAPSLYIPFMLFYPNKFSNQNTTGILTQLKESLSQILTIYYPFAGRLKDGVSVVCNDEGVEFLEARANGYLSEFLKQPNIAALNSFLPRNGNSQEKGCDIPLAAIKTTIFECGGIVIGVCILHKIGDAGISAAFVNSWAKIASGSNEKVDHPNFTFGSATFPPMESLESDIFRNLDNFHFQGSTSFRRRFVFNATAIKTLKKKTASKKVPNPSRVEALTAFVVEHMNAASRKAKSNNPVMLVINHVVNLRKRIEPPLPDNTFGNILWMASVFDYSTNSLEMKLNFVDLVQKLREAFASLNNKNLSKLGPGVALATMSELQKNLSTNEKTKIYRFTSWCNLGFYDIDFGWGKPIWVADMGNFVGNSLQQFVFIESGHSKGIELWLVADEQELSILEQDLEFLAYASPNPCIEPLYNQAGHLRSHL